MSAYCIIIGLSHDITLPAVVISGPEVPCPQQRARFKAEFMAPRAHKLYRQVQLLDSRRGITKRKSFITPAEAKRREKSLAAEAATPAPVEAAPVAEPPE